MITDLTLPQNVLDYVKTFSKVILLYAGTYQ